MANVNGRPITAKQKAAFLKIFSETGNATQAAEVAGFSRATAYRLRDSDPEFAKAWADAEAQAADRLEAEAYRRAVQGVERYVVSSGKIVKGEDSKPLIERHYSDQLLLALLRARSPDKFAERRQITGKNGGPVRIATLAEMTEEELLTLAAADAEGDGDDDHQSGPRSPDAGAAPGAGGSG